MLSLLIALLLLTILVGLVLLIAHSRRAARFGSLAGERIYQDSPQRPGELLYASSVPLCGKPDYLIRTPAGIVPVEYKSGRVAPEVRYRSHVFQLMAYCLLVSEHFGSRPSHGILKYADCIMERHCWHSLA